MSPSPGTVNDPGDRFFDFIASHFAAHVFEVRLRQNIIGVVFDEVGWEASPREHREVAPPDAIHLLRAELDAASAAAIIKVGRHFDRIRALLTSTGHADNAIVVEHATTARQRITPLSGFAHDERPYFSTILCYRGDEAWG